ncbi:hypothetical protein SAMN05192558_11245 [Actinokineospora alba]|uniref:DUF6801 domain-containing protein n=1 Tax=Actinokineospora alba TaxID=504798 RepID=A0A1H0UT26_9PSEU|nr:DUF6801 domain-containing protein [Actinokineospora alba]TDP69083.1 hypothetical protein C8E96_4654 [Actinokineospora alba]SDI79187.1 hypothetical protein SAMN05421871_107359 [Actinokineospora alba]SDP69281.1 hypothetical protein SAMN05192558_11245 [Actinokineospora alba]
MTAVLASVTTAGLVGAGLFIGAGTSAAASLDLNYGCTFPLIDVQPVKIQINASIPDTITAGVPTGEFQIEAISTLNEDTTTGLKLVKVATIEGTAMSTAHITAPGFDTDLDVPVTVEKTAIPASGGFTVKATGKTPSLKFPQAGPIKITVHDIVLNITAKKADGTLASIPPSNPFEAPCVQDPGQNNVLKEGQILPGGGGGTTTPTTPPSTTNPTTTTQPPVTTTTTKPPVTTTPGGGGTVKYGYTLAGKSNLKNMSGDVPLKGTIDANLTLATKKFTADLVLNPATANLSIMGFLPVVSKVEFVNERQTTGSIEADGALKSNSLLTIKLPQVSLFGFPISQSADCKTVTPSDINLQSAADFDVIAGGQLTGTYTIAPLKGCGSFNDYISGFAASAGNTIAVNLTSK